MRARVFVSCGQHSAKERATAKKICALLERLGFEAYLAIDVQTITEINTGILRELKNSDCYLLVNFHRDKLKGGSYRGSLFSNQELAIAHALGFERLLIVNQKGIAPEGMLRYIGVNTPTFTTHTNCINVVERAITQARWTPQYSRHLFTGELRLSHEHITYGPLAGRFLYLDIRNGRPDIAALEATARLTAFGKLGKPLQPSPVRSPLKATGRPGFSHTIFPTSHEAFDLLCVGNVFEPTFLSLSSPPISGSIVAPTLVTPAAASATQVFLNCALDVRHIPPLPISFGTWILEYQFFAIDFPILTVQIEFHFPKRGEPTAKVVSETSS